MCPEASQLCLRSHHALEDGSDALLADQRLEGLGLAVEQAVEPHVADGVETLFPALLAGGVDVLADVFDLIGVEGARDGDEAFGF